MRISKDKIRRVMDFLLKELGLRLSIISCYPYLLVYSLEKTIIPRSSVIRVLTSHGILNKDVNFISIFHLSEKKFLEKYVIKYQEMVPQVSQAYQGKTVFGD
ncbi:hypothetical protein QJS10_CPB04g00609 [Acorus calamus]|uniref:Uncharacterized protein n=1 Tax=Acorus calamus TaxID=4465 RepID=A0AAV9F2N2_ACOCL|nr:hypothetical protein QJS10_CPB04g00609 [Acorus calamus]